MKARMHESMVSLGISNKGDGTAAGGTTTGDEPSVQYTNEDGAGVSAAKDLTLWTTGDANRLSVISYTEDNNENLDLDLCSAGLSSQTLDDFKILKQIGRGGFAKVFLVQHNKTKDYHAIKCMRKD